jgi:hypothetical protein
MFINTKTNKYPYTEADWREFLASRHTSARPLRDMPAERLADFDLAIVQPVSRPTIDTMTQAVTEGAPALVDGVWVQVWDVTELTDEEKADRLQAKREGMTLTPFQARAVLSYSGMLGNVMALMAHEDTPDMIKIAWEYASEFRRMSPAILGMAGALGLTDEQLDSMFEQGSQIEV